MTNQDQLKEKHKGLTYFSRLTFASTLSHLRRINSPIGRDGKMAKPRQLHNTLWGMICPAETPEGAAVGLVKILIRYMQVLNSSIRQQSANPSWLSRSSFISLLVLLSAKIKVSTIFPNQFFTSSTGEEPCSDGVRFRRQHAFAHPRVLGGVEHGEPGGDRAVLHRWRHKDLRQRMLG